MTATPIIIVVVLYIAVIEAILAGTIALALGLGRRLTKAIAPRAKRRRRASKQP